jgi:membrane associated rhomboid family serine protease
MPIIALTSGIWRLWEVGNTNECVDLLPYTPPLPPLCSERRPESRGVIMPIVRPWKRAFLVLLCSLWLVETSTARDPLYTTTTSRRGSSSSSSTAVIRFASSRPWRGVPSSQPPRRQPQYSYQKQRRDYSTRFLDYDDFRRDPKARVWNVNFKTRNIGKLSWTSRIVLFNLAIFALQAVQPSITGWGMKLSDRIMAGQDLYRLVTPVFLHGGIFHLMTNMMSLKRTGGDLEKLFGPGRYIASYVVAGMAGNLLSAMQSPNPSLGASGAVFGVFGAYFVFLNRNEWLLGSYGEQMTSSITQTVAMNLFLGAINPVIDNWAHLGGALGGAAMAYAFGPRLFLTDLPGGGRIIVDRPVACLPPYLETMAKHTQRQIQRVVRKIPVIGRSNKPWRKAGRAARKFRVPTPNKSIRPRQVP